MRLYVDVNRPSNGNTIVIDVLVYRFMAQILPNGLWSPIPSVKNMGTFEQVTNIPCLVDIKQHHDVKIQFFANKC